MIRIAGEIVIVVDVVGFDAVDKSVYVFRVSHQCGNIGHNYPRIRVGVI